MLKKAEDKGVKFLLPVDNRGGATRLTANCQHEDRALRANIPDGWMGLDIGPKTTRALCRRDRRTPAP